MYDELRTSYQPKDLATLSLGGILVNNQIINESPVHLVLKSFNRHGLIAGATGSGKTKTIQVLAEQLSLTGVPSLVMDIKGDISGLAMKGASSEALLNRNKSLNLDFTPRQFPVEFLALGDSSNGIPLRATVNDFGPILFSRMLDLNETQEGVIVILFELAKQEKLSLIDLSDLKVILQFAQDPKGKETIAAQFGAIATTTIGTIMRKIISLETQGGNQFFGEPAFDAMDLVRTTPEGLGVISILRLLFLQDKPKLFSTFMLKLLSDVYNKMPELGDPEKPKLVLFIDEAHLIFNNASKALLSLLDTMVKLIRSKGVGLIFCTQTPNDIPDSVLSQLGLKVQHALRAFTAKDRKAMKLVAQNFPLSQVYQTEELLTSLGTGEVLLSGLDAKGQPTPLIQCMIRAPESRMGILTEQELAGVVAKSTLYPHYRDRQEKNATNNRLSDPQTIRTKAKERPTEDHPSVSDTFNNVTKNTLFRQVTRQLMRDLTRVILSLLGVKKR